MKKIRMTRDEWNSIGRRNGWLKTAESMIGTTGYTSRGKPGEWEPFREKEGLWGRDLENDKIKKMISDNLMYNKIDGAPEWMENGRCTIGSITLDAEKTGESRHIPGGTTHGYRADLDYTERDEPDTTERRNMKVYVALTARLYCPNGGNLKVEWRVIVPIRFDHDAGDQIWNMARNGSDVPFLVAKVLGGGGRVVAQNPPRADDQQEAPKKRRGLWERLFGKRSSFDWETGKVI